MRVLVDANVLLEVLTDDPQWFDWSSRQLDACAAEAEGSIRSWRPLVLPLAYPGHKGEGEGEGGVRTGFAFSHARRAHPFGGKPEVGVVRDPVYPGAKP